MCLLSYWCSYGERGWSIVVRFCNLVVGEYEPNSPVRKLDYSEPSKFIDTFLLAEVISIVISGEYQCSVPTALIMAWLSDPFGHREYPFDPECIVLKKVQSVQTVSELQDLVGKGEVSFMTDPVERAKEMYVVVLVIRF